MTPVLICGVVALFAVLFIWEAAPEARVSALHPAGLLHWLVGGNWLAKVGALLVSIGTGALLRYLMLTLTPDRDQLSGSHRRHCNRCCD
jgi:hypothetical protein